MVHLALALLALTATASTSPDDELPARAFLGARLAAAEEPEAVRVESVFESSSASAAGLAAGDVVLRFEGEPPGAPGEFAARVGALRAGDRVTLEYRRGDERRTVTIALSPRPRERHQGLEVRYGAVRVGPDRLRTITVVPAGDGPHPTVLFLQGLSCSSIDTTFAPGDPVRQLVFGLAEAGFLVHRVEKSGVGDSEGPPCSELGLLAETAGFLAALRDLKSAPGVDPERVFLFGHSMGGVIAPKLAAEEPVRGILVFGTIAEPFLEYMLANARRQDRLAGVPPARSDADNRARLRLWHHLYVEGLDRAQVLAAHPDLASLSDRAGFDDDTHMWGRSLTFFRELVRENLADNWARAAVPTLALHGEYDWVSGASDHDLIAEVVNGVRPGAARSVQVDRMDHGFLTYDSLAASYERRRTGPFGPAIVTLSADWMRARLAE
jgi:pimeloyl-ACP methyl ester carboxylesterase